MRTHALTTHTGVPSCTRSPGGRRAAQGLLAQPSLLRARRAAATRSESLGRSEPSPSRVLPVPQAPWQPAQGLSGLMWAGSHGWLAAGSGGRGAAGDLWRRACAGAMCHPRHESTGRAGPGWPCPGWPLPGKGGEDGEGWASRGWRSMGRALLCQPAAVGREPPRCKFRSSNACCYSNLAPWGHRGLAGGAGRVRDWDLGMQPEGWARNPLLLCSPSWHLALSSAPCIILPLPLGSFLSFPYLHPGLCVASTLFVWC